MKLHKMVFFVLLLSGWPADKVVAQQLDFELRYNDAAALYEVYATPDSSNTRYFVGGGSQLSIVLPQDLADIPLEITTIAGGLWTDNSTIYAPAADHIHDFHGIASNGAMVNFVEEEPLLLFTFELPGGICRSDIRLFENAEDLNPNAAGMNGSDFRNFMANVFKPSENNWLKNKHALNADCPHAPSVANNTLTTRENISATICMPINDPNVGDLFEGSLCANVSPSLNSISNVSISGNEICVEYIPAEGFVGTEAICIEVCDNSGLCNTSTVSILVEPEPVYSSITAFSDRCQNTLDWTIFDPSIFEYFELERSEDDDNYVSLAVFESNGQTENTLFNYVDEQVELNYFYRLKLVFTDGRVNYEEPLFLNTICEEEIISHASVSAVANGCETEIHWSITDGQIGSRYELQRSSAEDEFKSLVSREHTNELSNLAFHFTDKDTKGDHHYRIKIVYMDGTETYSESVFVASDCKIESKFLLYPNPISQSQPILTMKFMAETKTVKILISDVKGRVVRRLNLEVELGINTHRFDVTNFAAGTYFIAIEGKENIVKSFVKIDERF